MKVCLKLQQMTHKFIFKTAIIISVISNHDNVRVWFDESASEYFI